MNTNFGNGFAVAHYENIYDLLNNYFKHLKK